MANNPINLGARFFLELAMLFNLGYWGWTQHQGLPRYLLAFGLPLAAAVLWGVFRVPGDPRDAPVAVPGALRLGLELFLFGAAIWALYASDKSAWGTIMLIVVVTHYLVSYDRVRLLLKGV
jgi:hypothetical protein